MARFNVCDTVTVPPGRKFYLAQPVYSASYHHTGRHLVPAGAFRHHSGRGLAARVDSRDRKRHIQPERPLPERSECLSRQASKDHRGFGQVGPLFPSGSTAGFAGDLPRVPFCRARRRGDKIGGRDS